MAPLRPNRRLPLTALLAAQAVSVTGNRIALLAIPWFVLQTTGSATQAGVAAAANTVPAMIAGLLAGPLIDRAGFKVTSVTADVASGLTIAAIPLLHQADLLTHPALLGLVFLGALLDAPGEIARRSLLPDLAAHAGVSIDRAASLHETIFRTTQLLGAPLGGVLIASLGATQALLVDAGTFAMSAVLVSLFVRLPRTTLRAADAFNNTQPYFTQIADAWRFLRQSQLLRSLVGVFIGANILENGFVQVLLPVISDRVYDRAVVLGLLVGAIGAGALLGVGLHTIVANRFSRRAILLPAFLLAGAPKFLLMAAFPPAAMAVVGIFVFSVAAGPVNPISGAMEYELIPREMRGRVFGLLGVAFIGSVPIGALGAGVLAEALGLRQTLIVGAVLYLAVSLIPFLHPAWTNLENLTSAGHVGQR